MVNPHKLLEAYERGHLTDIGLILDLLRLTNMSSVKDVLPDVPVPVLRKLERFVNEYDGNTRVLGGAPPAAPTVAFVRDQLRDMCKNGKLVPARARDECASPDARRAGPTGDRGSKAHVLDLVSSPAFRHKVDNLFGDQGIRLAEHGYPRPLGRRTPADWREYELEEYMRALPVPGHKPLDLKWWIPHKTGMNRRPTWDLLCHILVKGKPGLLLVEAKAHVGEMSEQDKKSRPTGSNESQCNDRRIRHNISETNTLLSGLGYGQFSLSVDHHYQLANRIAYLSKLARDGIPVVLSYLGWLKSPAWPRDFFRDRSDWEEVMRRYTSGVLPGDFPGKVVQFENGGSMQMLVRSLEVEA